MSTATNTHPLLIQEPPLQVLPSLATAIGLNQAIVLQQIHYWLGKSRHVHDGRPWIYNSYPAWQAQFPFWSVDTVKRTIASLEESGLVISGAFNDSPYNRTKWYSIDYGKLPQSTSLQIAPIDDGKLPPSTSVQIAPIDDGKLPSCSIKQENTLQETTDREGTGAHAPNRPLDQESFSEHEDGPRDDGATGDSAPPPAAAPDVWPEWYSLLYGIEGFKTPFEAADAWRQKNDISERLALDKAYALRDWWPRQPAGRRSNGDPYATFQNWTRRDKDQPLKTPVGSRASRVDADFSDLSRYKNGFLGVDNG